MVRLVMWDRLRDQFEPGSWFKGRIFADRSDISPDGRHFIYFAMGGVAWAIPATGGTWTAISRLPSLKADALWGQGNTWGGGGIFLSNTSFWLHSGDCTFLIRDESGLRRMTYGPHLAWHERLERAGWVRKGGSAQFPIREKTLHEGWILRKTPHERGYELELPGECRMTFPAWEWADWDRDRLAWAENGFLRAARLGSSKLGTIRTLYDFNGMLPPARREQTD
jgi:hypothetical protein